VTPGYPPGIERAWELVRVTAAYDGNSNQTTTAYTTASGLTTAAASYADIGIRCTFRLMRCRLSMTSVFVGPHIH
jgi:hypothetical protein